jgi:hypothetical protein
MAGPAGCRGRIKQGSHNCISPRKMVATFSNRVGVPTFVEFDLPQSGKSSFSPQESEKFPERSRAFIVCQFGSAHPRGKQRGPCGTISCPGGRMLSLEQGGPLDRRSGSLAEYGAVLVEAGATRRRTGSDEVRGPVFEIRRGRERRASFRPDGFVELDSQNGICGNIILQAARSAASGPARSCRPR